MFPAERLNKIKEMLLEKKQLNVSTLSKKLHVTEVTVRRDLEKLENENFLTRTHGGAILNESTETLEVRNVLIEEAPNSEQYKIIGEIANYFINDDDVVFLGAGTVNRYIARALKGRSKVSVVTTDLLVALDLSTYVPEVKVICPGGDINPHKFQLHGRITEDAIKKLYFNIAFINVDGVSLEKGYTVDSIDKAYIADDVASVSKKTIAVCDYTAFNQTSFAPLGPINLYKTIISSEQTPQEYKEYFFNNKIQFFCTFDIYERKINE
jgi:DeoR/GlpR family transcriptional regulator of sugar metabolism